MGVNKVFVDKEKADEMIDRLYNQLLPYKSNWQVVVGIKNGGLNVSIPIAKMLSLPHFPLLISYYLGETRRENPVIEKTEFNIKNYAGILVIDDVVDSGDTILLYESTYGLRMRDSVACLYWANGNHKIIPDFFVEEKKVGNWIQFYWEKQ